ncbi:MAG TPA: sugar ABC transporter ATP-binding protein, partial [Spirochaetia bacterium]|nr:sugar ABC transporter ATP-binding protein [Spirochaetia bacterium]
VKVITGVHQPDAGEVLLAGQPIHPDSPLAAQKLGISTVYQEVNLCSNLSVAENIFIGRQPARLGAIDWRAMNRQAEEAMAKLNVKVAGDQILSSCSIAVQQMVAIARALLDTGTKILILDEPTSSLDPDEVQQLFKVIRQLRAGGLAVLFITHFLDQMYDICDRITILRNGVFEGEYLKEALPKMDLVTKMLGKELSEFSTTSAAGTVSSVPRDASADDSVLSVRGLGLAGSIAAFDLDIRAGDILGLAGLLGSGRTEMARLIFGIDPADQGETRIKGKKTKIHSPAHAMAAGLAFCSEDRKEEGILADLTVRENIILALQGQRGLWSYLPAKKQEEIADAFIKQLKIKTPGSSTEVKRLSGGNQQKVLLARALATDPSLLLLDEPTRGIDVGAKREIMELILRLSREGKSILFISSEFEEVLRCSNRIAVLKDKAKVAELTGTDMNEGTIMRTIAGVQ